MKKVAIVFNQAPHGTACGREALDLSLALSDINQIAIFFMNDGVFHLLPTQQPEHILMRDYISTFGMLELYDITDVHICETSLSQRGLTNQSLIIEGKIVNKQTLTKQLATSHTILQF